MAAGGETTQELLQTLDSLSFKAKSKPVAYVPQHHHFLGPGWMPPPALDEVRKLVSEDCNRNFNRFVKNVGTEFSEPGYLHPKQLNLWVAARVTQPTRSHSCPKGFPPLRIHHQPLEMETPDDKLCHPMHRTWLEKHAEQRDRHLNPVYFARKDVQKAQAVVAKREEQVRRTRELLTTPQVTKPNLGKETKAKLGNVMTKLRTGRAFADSTGGLAAQQEESKKAQKALGKSLSAPVLRFVEPEPEHRARHIRPWKGPDKPLRHLRLDTPWMHEDEVKELKHKRGNTLLSAEHSDSRCLVDTGRVQKTTF